MKTIFRLVLRTQVTRGRVAALGALGLLAIVLAIVVRAQDTSGSVGPDTSLFEIIDRVGLSVLAPVTALVLASAALGDLAEDRTLVYVWLKPLARWRFVLGAYAATVAAAVPFAAVPLVAAALIGGADGALLGATLVSSLVAVFGYSSLFLGLGLRVRRALVWGLAYVVIWEGAIARTARGAARLSVQVYARSLLAHISDNELPRQSAGVAVSIIVPVLVIITAYFVTVRWLETADVA